MSKSDQNKGAASQEQAAKQARLEEALRANLHRRKAQSRGRKADLKAASKAESGAEQDDSAAKGHDKD